LLLLFFLSLCGHRFCNELEILFGFLLGGGFNFYRRKGADGSGGAGGARQKTFFLLKEYRLYFVFMASEWLMEEDWFSTESVGRGERQDEAERQERRDEAERQERQDETLKRMEEMWKRQDETLMRQDETLKKQDETLKRQDETLMRQEEVIQQLVKEIERLKGELHTTKQAHQTHELLEELKQIKERELNAALRTHQPVPFYHMDTIVRWKGLSPLFRPSLSSKDSPSPTTKAL
jgi:hypothetical protein